MIRQSLLFVLGVLVTAGGVGIQAAAAQENRMPTVGAPGSIEQILLPGTELAARPLDDNRIPMVVRIIDVFPHGDGFRYDIAFQGLEPGKYNLAEFLVRKDGSSTADLPAIPVEIMSLLPPGQVEPNELETGLLPRLGGYRFLMITATLFWLLILGGLIFIGWGKKRSSPEPVRQLTLADLLKPRLEMAINEEMDVNQFAELERMLIAFWRRRLDLESVSPKQAIAKIKADSDAGPLMIQLERWMHDPNRDVSVDLSKLLKPYREISSELLSSAEAKIIEHEF